MKSVIIRWPTSSVLVVMTAMCVQCFPQLCDQLSQPLEGIKSMTQMVNDSYFVVLRTDRTAVFDGSANTLFESRVQLEPSMSFVIDLDVDCFNVEETLFVIQKSANSKPVQYQTYTKANWSSPYLMNVTNAGHPALDAVQSKGISLMNDKFFVIYFASYGLLVIKPNQGGQSAHSMLVTCSEGDGQWKLHKQAITNYEQISAKVDMNKIEFGFHDTNDKSIYLFPEPFLRSDSKPVIDHLFSCTYELDRIQNKIALYCTQHEWKKLCRRSPPHMNAVKVAKMVALVLISLAIIALLIAICLKTCCQRFAKPNNEDNLPKTKSLTTGVSVPVTETVVSN